MTESTTDDIFEALKVPLGVIDNPERQQQIKDYIEAARVNVERSVFDLLAQFAEAVNEEVSAHYEVTLNYKPGVLDLDVKRREAREPDDAGWSMADGEVEKITIRLPAEPQERAAEAAKPGSTCAQMWPVCQRPAAGLLVRAPRLTESLWYDEIVAWTSHTAGGPVAIMGSFAEPSNHIAHTLLTWCTVAAFEQSLGFEIALRLPALLFSLAALAAMYGLAREVTRTRPAAIAAGLTAVLPVAVLEAAAAPGYRPLIRCSALGGWPLLAVCIALSACGQDPEIQTAADTAGPVQRPRFEISGDEVFDAGSIPAYAGSHD